MATFSDYVRRKVPFLGGTVELDVRALSVERAPEFVAQVKAVDARWKEVSERAEGETDEQYGARLEAAFREQETFILEILGKTIETKKGPKGYYVRLPEPLVNEEDDSKIEDCRTLGLRGGRMFRMAVLREISSLAEVDPFLGNSSGSPSTSTVATGLNTSESPASTTVVSGCSPSSSTVTAPISLVQSSTPAA